MQHVVDDLGCVMDSSGEAANNSTKIQAYIDSLVTSGVGGGLTIPGGTLYIGSTLQYPLRTTDPNPWGIPFMVRGTGVASTLRYTGDPALPGVLIKGKSPTLNPVTPGTTRQQLVGMVLKGCSLQVGSLATSESPGIGKSCWVRDVLITEVPTDREAALIVEGYDGGSFRDVYCYANDTNGAKFELSHQVGLHNFVTRENGGVGIYVIQGSGWYGNLYTESNDDWGYVFENGPRKSDLMVWAESNNRQTLSAYYPQGVMQNVYYGSYGNKIVEFNFAIIDEITKNSSFIYSTDWDPVRRIGPTNLCTGWTLARDAAPASHFSVDNDSDPKTLTIETGGFAVGGTGDFNCPVIEVTGPFASLVYDQYDWWEATFDIRPGNDATWQYWQKRGLAKQDGLMRIGGFGSDNLSGGSNYHVLNSGRQIVPLKLIQQYPTAGTMTRARFDFMQALGMTDTTGQPDVQLVYEVHDIEVYHAPFGVYSYQDAYGYDGGTLNSIVPFLSS